MTNSPLPSLALLAAALLLASCGSSKTGKTTSSTPKWNPSSTPTISRSSETPPHNLPRHEYPFDSKGNYVSAWAIEGERRAGRSTSSSSSSRSSSSRSRSSRSSTGAYRYHKVAAGDTLWGLSRKYGTTVSAIKKANGLSSDTIVNGRTLKIPRG
ncbi:MAG: LysM peptidoglycan-binding domain-containing protein [Verrucomicrobiota bacterium]